MPDVKISSKVDKKTWDEFRDLASESNQHISGLLTEAIRDYIGRRRVRPDVLRHLDDSMREHADLGRRLAE